MLLGSLHNNEYISVSEAASEARRHVHASLSHASERSVVLRRAQKEVASVIPALHAEFGRIASALESQGKKLEAAVQARRAAWAEEAGQEREGTVSHLMRRCEGLVVLRDGLSNAVCVGDQLYERADELDALEIMRDLSRGLTSAAHCADALSNEDIIRRLTHTSIDEANGRAGTDTGGCRVFVFGGNDGVEDLRSGEIMVERGWEPIGAMQNKRRSAGCAVLAGRVYVVGGWGGGGALSSCEVYDVPEGRWRSCAGMHVRRQALGVCALHGRLYAVGGFDGTSNLASVERYDPVTDEWIMLQSMSVQRRGCAAVATHVSIHLTNLSLLPCCTGLEDCSAVCDRAEREVAAAATRVNSDYVLSSCVF